MTEVLHNTEFLQVDEEETFFYGTWMPDRGTNQQIGREKRHHLPLHRYTRAPTPVNTTQQSRNICITFVQRRPNVSDVGPTLYKCYTNVSCLLVKGITIYVSTGASLWSSVVLHGITVTYRSLLDQFIWPDINHWKPSQSHGDMNTCQEFRKTKATCIPFDIDLELWEG